MCFCKRGSLPMKVFKSINLAAFESDINALKKELRADVSTKDLDHLRKMMWWGRACSMFGYVFAWVPNPISMGLLSTGSVVRWAMVAHHILHRGYDKVPNVPRRLTSKGFARGWRRYVDWIDWLDPKAWSHEHNVLHHYKLGETLDPDQPEEVLDFLRKSELPRPLQLIFLFIVACTWKFFYYAPNTAAALYAHEERTSGKEVPHSLLDWRMWLPFAQPGFRLWTRSWLPYVFIRFGLLPLPFLLLGTWAYLAALINLVGAEILSNLHSFIIIVPNHAGDDLFRFNDSISDRGEFYLRQVIGSVNYSTGGNINDFLHGWLNYQIEHHVFPDMTMRQYAIAQPRLQAICEKHGVPYVQESVWERLKKLIAVAVGDVDMPVYEESFSDTELEQG